VGRTLAYHLVDLLLQNTIHQHLKTKNAGFGGLRFLPNTLRDIRNVNLA
jgi:hypothetical protein